MNQRTNEVIKYQREYLDKKNQVEKLKSLLTSKTGGTNKIPVCPSTFSSSTKRNESSKTLPLKTKNSNSKVRDFSEYDRDCENFLDEIESRNPTKLLSSKGSTNEMIDISDKGEVEQKTKLADLKTNKNSSCLKKNSNRDAKIDALNQKINEKKRIITTLKSRVNQLENMYKSMDELNLLKDELENKLKISSEENAELTTKIKEYETKMQNLNKILEEKNSVIQKAEQDLISAEKSNQDFENMISNLEKNLLLTNNLNKEQEEIISEKNNIIKEKEEEILDLEKKINGLNETITRDQISLTQNLEEMGALKEKIRKNENENNINNNELIRQKKKFEEKSNQNEKEINLLKLELNRIKEEAKKNESKFKEEIAELNEEKKKFGIKN